MIAHTQTIFVNDPRGTPGAPRRAQDDRELGVQEGEGDE
jgi:hypothetical protein